MKITKKEYINSLNFDLDSFKADLDKGQFPIWHLGSRLSKFQVVANVAELEAEAKKIATDRTYRPWNEK